MTVSIPGISSIGDVYELHWEKEGLYIVVDHIAENENISGEFHVSLNGNGKKREHLYQARLNMLSVSAKKGFSEALRKRRDDLEWETIIEQSCFKTIQSYRQGDPVTIVGDLPKRIKARYRMYPFILDEGITSLFGYGGSGKSYVAAFIAISIQTGLSFLGYNPIMGNVLILDWEASKEDWDERIKAICAGMGIDSPLMLYKRCSRTLSNDIIEIQKIVLDEDVKLVIIDSVGMASELSSEYHTSAIQMLRAARSLGVSVLLLDHKTKSNEQFGSIYKTNEVRAAFELKSARDITNTQLDISIKNTKINNGPFCKTQAMRIEFSGDDENTEVAKFTRIDPQESEELSKGEPVWTRIQYVLKRGPLTIDDIATEISEDKNAVTTNLNRHKQIFIKLTNGKWGLKENGYQEGGLL